MKKMKFTVPTGPLDGYTLILVSHTSIDIPRRGVTVIFRQIYWENFGIFLKANFPDKGVNF
jgi:hypothetical protein